MEPAETSLVIHTTTVATLNTRGDAGWVFTLRGIHEFWYMTGAPCLAVGDRVRIIVQKEPNPHAK
jgi:hypothetical protein